jgi:hypothetical protein
MQAQKAVFQAPLNFFLSMTGSGGGVKYRPNLLYEYGMDPPAIYQYSIMKFMLNSVYASVYGWSAGGLWLTGRPATASASARW